MGCGSGQKQILTPVRLQTVNGILKVTITKAKIEHQTSKFFSMDPYIKIRISNQHNQTKVLLKGGKQPVFNQTFSFFINSCFQQDGRKLQLQLWDQNKTSDSLIGFGIADLDPILNQKKKKQDLRVFLNYDCQNAALVHAVLEFKEEQIELLNIRFETASIRRKTSTIGNMNCSVRVTLGEEVLSTQKKKDTKELPPVWADQILTLNALKSIQTCLIEVLDDEEIVGSTTIPVDRLLAKQDEQNFDEQIDFEDVIAGTLRFQTILGVNPKFSVLKRDYRRKEEKEKAKKEQQDSQLKGKDKKQAQKQNTQKEQKQKETAREQVGKNDKDAIQPNQIKQIKKVEETA